jgi:hypothetical protein
MENKDANQEAATIGNILLSDAVFRPMLYSTVMVQALLNGTKTKTRRTQGLEDLNQSNEIYDWQFVTIYSDDDEKSVIGFKARNGFSDTWKEVFKKINIGDIIWVRETFFESSIPAFPEPITWLQLEYGASEQTIRNIIYKADFPNISVKWKPSLFMPKSACRLWLKVTNVRVEKLQDISEEDAINEGIIDSLLELPINAHHYHNYLATSQNDEEADSAIDSYKSLWQKINGKDSWDANPFVWVYDFEVIREAPYGFR